MTIQATKKLQDLLGIKVDDVPTDEEPLSLWHGNIFKVGRRSCLLVTHNESYYSVFVYADEWAGKRSRCHRTDRRTHGS